MSGGGVPAQKPVRVLSQRKNFLWQLGSMSAYMLSQWLLLVLLARASGPSEVGRFTLMLAVSAPVFLTVGMNLRVVLATDSGLRWRMNDFLALQPVVNTLAGMVTVVVGATLGLRGVALLALAVLSVAKSIETRSQVYYGYFQRNRRFDLIAVSMLSRAIAGPGAFLLGYLTTHSLVMACVGLAVGWFACQTIFDKRNAARIAPNSGLTLNDPEGTSVARVRALARKAFPLGLDQGVSSLAINVPRYAVQSALGVAQLGVFGGLAYLSQAASMVTSSLNIIFVSPLADHYHHGRTRAFGRVMAYMGGLAVVLLVVPPAVAWFVGEPFLRVTLGREYANRGLLTVLMVAAGAAGLQRALCKALEASQWFKIYLWIDVITTATIAGTAYPFVRWWGLPGAAWAMTTGFAVGTVLVLGAIARIMKEMASRGAAADGGGTALRHLGR